MTKSKRFEPIHEIANSSANDLSRTVADAERRLADMERQFEQLKVYRGDYIAKSGQGRDSMDAVRLQNFRSFIDRLSDAIRLQGEAVSVSRADYESKRTQWAQKRVEADALGKAVERFRLDERRAQDRREQKESDDSVLRRHSVDHSDA